LHSTTPTNTKKNHPVWMALIKSGDLSPLAS
jgi:hypothetical protein